MNSSDQLTVDSSTAENSPNVLSKRDAFLTNYHPSQAWSIPKPIIYYATKNPSSAKVYQKLTQICKYFFIQNPFLIVYDLELRHDKNKWNISSYTAGVDVSKVTTKIWVTKECSIYNLDQPELICFSSLLRKIYKIDIRHLILHKQISSINDLSFLASKCESIWFDLVNVLNENGQVVPLEKWFPVFHNLQNFSYALDTHSSAIITSKTASELFKISHFLKLELFCLIAIPEIFDIDNFYKYMKTNNKTKIYLRFSDEISHRYRIRLQDIVNEMIVKAKNRECKMAIIYFSAIDMSTYREMIMLYLQK